MASAQELVASCSNVFTLPEIYYRVRDVVDNPDSTMDELAKILKDCPAVRMEVAGHTDAQGSEGGNQALSQARAEAVVVALQGRQVNVAGLKAVGYGESRPIADNQLEEGREANRRIEFTLIVEAPAPAAGAGGAEAVDGPDFSGDMSPSVAPTEKTRRPKRRPGDFQ